MKILIVDDHVSFCEGLIAAMANLTQDYHFQFESDSQLVPNSLLGKPDFDLLIVDLMMPGLGGTELIRYLNQNKNQIPIIVMSSVQDPAMINEVFELGIVGYMPKSYSVYQIANAIEHCRAGNMYVPDFLNKSLTLDGEEVPEDGVSEFIQLNNVNLTKRQVQILSLMDQGLSNQEIADQLFIALPTVKSHLKNLFRLFNVSNRVACLRAAKNAGVNTNI